jgi:hypothetical protein
VCDADDVFGQGFSIPWMSEQAKNTLEEVGWYRVDGEGKVMPVKLVVHKI